MRVSCPSCGAPVPAADVHLENLAAKCRRCDEVFSITDRTGRVGAPRRRPPLPKGLRIEVGEPPLPEEGTYRTAPSRELGELVVRQRWWQWSVLLLTLWVLGWDGFLVVWYVVVLGKGDPAPMMVLIPLVHVAAGAGVTYWTLAVWLNTTTIRVADGRLTVQHGPIPWFGNHELPIAELRQLYLRRKVRRGKNGQTIRWEVRAETEEHAELKLIGGLRDRNQAEYIEWVIEQHLGIEDVPSMNDR